MKTTTIKSNAGKKSRFKIMGWLFTAVGATGMLCTTVQAERVSYSFIKLATLEETAPRGGYHINDFEPGAINNSGDVGFGTDLGTSTDPATFFGEGVFLRKVGQKSELELARAGGNAPGGGVFDFLLLGQVSLNNEHDAAFAFTLSPFGSPVGVNSGLYRYSHSARKVTPAVIPRVTPAPAGGTFAGVFFGTSLNDLGQLIFPGIVATDKGIHLPDEPYIGLGMGVFKADNQNQITSVVSPGDRAPKGGSFDSAGSGGMWVNRSGDVAFTAHVAGEEVTSTGSPPQKDLINALGSLYLKNALTGTITSIAHARDPAPGGGHFRQLISPVMNDLGEIAFLGDLSKSPQANQVAGVYRFSEGKITRVAGPGDSMPGGGNLVTASILGSQQIHINNESEIVFNAVLSTDVNNDGIKDTGLFVWSNGSLRLVARTSTVIPGVGTVAQLVMGVIVIPTPPVLIPNSGAINNDLGQVLFGAKLSDGRGVLLVATPTENEASGEMTHSH